MDNELIKNVDTVTEANVSQTVNNNAQTTSSEATVATIETSKSIIGPAPINNWDKPLWRSVLSSSDGSGSTARVGILAVILSSIFWVCWCVFKNHTIPDLTGLTLYQTSIITVLYAPNKITEVLNNSRNKS